MGGKKQSVNQLRCSSRTKSYSRQAFLRHRNTSMRHSLGLRFSTPPLSRRSNSARQKQSHRLTRGRHPSSPPSTQEVFRIAPLRLRASQTRSTPPNPKRCNPSDPFELPTTDESNFFSFCHSVLLCRTWGTFVMLTQQFISGIPT